MKSTTSGLSDVRGILLDIEGTTTPIAFVHDVLFSYARSQVRNYLLKSIESPEVLADIARLHEEYVVDLTDDLNPPTLIGEPLEMAIETIVSYVNWLIDRDRKSPALKSLQGKIWREGYLDGTLKAQVFADVPPAFDRWHSAGLKISIFSSGSALAQQLLFAHTESGDLSRFISHYFDTTVGPKTSVDSYRQIAAALSLNVNQVLFISDTGGELDAANQAGMHTLLSVRPGNKPLEYPVHCPRIESFDTL